MSGVGWTCVILAGGLGTRLRSVLSDAPKPMAEVNGRPFLAYVLDQVRRAGLIDVILCVGYKAEVIEDHVADGRTYGLHVRYSRERDLLGTAGALRQARDLIRSDPFLAFNGDSYCEVEIGKLIEQHRARGATATIAVCEVEEPSRYGSTMLGASDRIISFSEKMGAGPRYINGGVYALNQSVLDLVPSGQPSSIERDIFPLLAGDGLYAFRTAGTFIDIGTPADLERAQTVLRGLLRDGVGA